jgi:hypothetical protein
VITIQSCSVAAPLAFPTQVQDQLQEPALIDTPRSSGFSQPTSPLPLLPLQTLVLSPSSSSSLLTLDLSDADPKLSRSLTDYITAAGFGPILVGTYFTVTNGAVTVSVEPTSSVNPKSLTGSSSSASGSATAPPPKNTNAAGRNSVVGAVGVVGVVSAVLAFLA